MKQWGNYFHRAMTKEERDEYELNKMFKKRYSNTFDAIGKGGFDDNDDEENDENHTYRHTRGGSINNNE